MDRDAQLEELDAIRNIFIDDGCQIIEHDNQDIKVILWINVSVPENYLIKYKENLSTDEYSYVRISNLPPFRLHLKLPNNYPSKCSPQFTIYCKWLTKLALSKVCRHLDKIWCDNGNMEIIYNWVDFIKNDVLIFLGYVTELDVTELHSFYSKFFELKEREICEKSSEELETEDFDVNRKSKMSTSDVENLQVAKTNWKNGRTEINLNRHDKCKSFFYCNSKVKKYDSAIGNQGELDFLHDKRAKLDLLNKNSLIQHLINYNMEKENLVFQNKCFTCSICFSDQKGSNCIKFDNCNHVFCKNCIFSYFSVKINEGNVQSIKCPETKCSSVATPGQVKSVVTSELFAKYDTLLLYSYLHSIEQIVYCPRIFCQYPAMRNPDENVVMCPSCQYAFCINCKRTYHGIEPCKLKAEEKKKLLEEYLNSSKESQEQLEVRYGKKYLVNLVNASMNESWIEGNCKNCPNCNVSIEKSDGCNNMECWKCGSYFCWMCSTVLDSKFPYDHFINMNSPCARRLYYLEDLNVEDVEEDSDSEDDEFNYWN